MKKEKRIQNQLTSKKARIISSVVAMICGIIFFWLPYSRGEEIFMSVMIALVTIFVIFVLCYYIFLKGTDRENKELLQVDGIKVFSKDELTEIIFVPGSRSYENLEDLTNAGCRFFAKLDENENIILIIHNRDDKKIYEDKMENYFHAKCKIKI